MSSIPNASSTFQIQRRLVRQARRSSASLALAVLAGALGGVTIVVQARLVSLVVAGAFLAHQALPALWPLMRALLGVLLLRAGLVYGAEVAAHRTARVVKQGLQANLFDHLLALGPGYARANRAGELATALTSGIEALDAYYSQYLPQLALAALIPLTILLAVFPLDTLSGVVLLVTAPLIPLFMVLIGGHSEALTRRQWGQLGRLAAVFLDTLQGLATLKMLGQSQARAETLAQAGEAYRQRTLAVLRVTFLSALALELVATISTAVVAVEIGLRLLAGGIDYRQALFILILAPEFYLPLRQLGMRFHAGISGVSAARRLFDILQTPLPAPGARVSAGPGREEASLSHPLEIRFEGVRYTYPGASGPALSDLSFGLPAGSRTALVGASGAGKSTLMALLLRFAEPGAGAMTVGGRPLSTIPPDEWRRQVAWAPQSPYLFNASLGDNLRLGRPAAAPDELWDALAWAHLDAFVRGLPAGLDTRLGEAGLRLSGGQAQRLVLARAYLKDAPYLLLDEPGASLDPEQEALMLATLERLCQGRSVLVIAHRLATLRQAVQVLVLERGRLVESGAPGELLARGGWVSRLALGGDGVR